MFKRNNSSGWETSPIVCRWRCFKAYLVFRLPLTLAAMALWFYLLGEPGQEALSRVQSGFVRAGRDAPGSAYFMLSYGVLLTTFVFAKAPSRECMALIARATRPVRSILATKNHGKGGLHSGFATLLEHFDTRYKRGHILLGASPYDPGLWLGQDDDRGLFTFGPAGSGKQRAGTLPVGATWPFTFFCIDVKGQHVNVLYEQRQKFGPVSVVAPFGRLREGIETCRFDPVGGLDPKSNAYFEDVSALAEAIVMPTDKRNFFFDDSARQIIAGVISHVRTTYPEYANLVTVRKLLTTPKDRFKAELQAMQENKRDGGLARAAASRILRSEGSNELNAVMATVDYNTQWVTSRALAQTLSKSDFSIADMKDKPSSLFLCIPVEELDKHGRFMRMFIYMIVRECAKKKAKVPILMILDEFYSCGAMSFMTKTVSHIRGFNTRLYPIAQNYSQLDELYGVNALTWMANTGSVAWMSLNDKESKDQLSQILGRYTTDGRNFFDMRERSELGKLTSRESGMTVVTRNGKSPLLVRQIKYDIALPKRMFSPDPEHPLEGWAKVKHTLQRAWYRINLWI